MTNNEYENATWREYARCHLSVLTSMQWALFKEAAAWLAGDVVDCGCGSAKLAPLLVENEAVTSYTGIDYSPDMTNVARGLISKLFAQKPLDVITDKIENVSGQTFSSAVSIHSYYTWTNTEQVLAGIYRLLRAGSYFVLVTPNPELDMVRLMRESEKELLGHPDFEAFKNLNILLSENLSAKWATMDHLIEETRRMGFQVTECHQRHYLGGVNFLVLKK